MYRVARLIEIESAHRLSKHPGPCRYVHGHTRKIEVVISAEMLDKNDMVCDFKAVKAVIKKVIDKYDHAIYLNSEDKDTIRGLSHISDRIIIMDQKDPTSEVLARLLFDEINIYIDSELNITADGDNYIIQRGLTLERIRVW